MLESGNETDSLRDESKGFNEEVPDACYLLSASCLYGPVPWRCTPGLR